MCILPRLHLLKNKYLSNVEHAAWYMEFKISIVSFCNKLFQIIILGQIRTYSIYSITETFRDKLLSGIFSVKNKRVTFYITVSVFFILFQLLFLIIYWFVSYNSHIFIYLFYAYCMCVNNNFVINFLEYLKTVLAFLCLSRS